MAKRSVNVSTPDKLIDWCREALGEKWAIHVTSTFTTGSDSEGKFTRSEFRLWVYCRDKISFSESVSGATCKDLALKFQRDVWPKIYKLLHPSPPPQKRIGREPLKLPYTMPVYDEDGNIHR